MAYYDSRHTKNFCPSLRDSEVIGVTKLDF